MVLPQNIAPLSVASAFEETSRGVEAIATIANCAAVLKYRGQIICHSLRRDTDNAGRNFIDPLPPQQLR